jgi:uncharacterized protein (DUF488 family)
MTNRLVTIGVYGFSEEGFFKALMKAGVDTFCDIRQRRGVRGSLYAFANSTRLQNHLNEIGIRYIYLKDLAPPQNIRAIQKKMDQQRKEAKSKRTGLAPEFIQMYQKEILLPLEPQWIIDQMGHKAKVVALFCVESTPSACHRSLVAQYVSTALSIPVEDILP